MRNLLGLAKQLQSECGFSVAIVANGPVPKGGPRAQGLNIILNDRDGHRPNLSQWEHCSSQKLTKFDVGTSTSNQSEGRKLTPSKLRAREERESLTSDYISPFGATLMSSIVNQQQDNGLLEISQQEVDSFVSRSESPITVNEVTIPSPTQSASSEPTRNVVTNMTVVPPKTMPVSAQKSLPTNPITTLANGSARGSRYVFVSPATVTEDERPISGNLYILIIIGFKHF